MEREGQHSGEACGPNKNRCVIQRSVVALVGCPKLERSIMIVRDYTMHRAWNAIGSLKARSIVIKGTDQPGARPGLPLSPLHPNTPML